MQNSNNDPKYLGQKFGRLTVIGFQKGNGKGGVWDWILRCDCGKQIVAAPYTVKSGNTRSCGCLKNEVAAARFRKFKHSTKDNKRLYEILSGMKKRCYNKNSPRYMDYGGRGISVCSLWTDENKGFDNFVDWALANGYTDEMTIDRIDVDGDYCPENCRWVPLQDQANNKRDTKWVVYRGERIQLRALCKRLGLRYYTIYNRIYNIGWPVEKAIEQKSLQKDSLMKRCRGTGLSYQTVHDRVVKLGWDEETALTTPTLGRGANRGSYGKPKEKRICKVCGAEFEANSGKQIYCGSHCRYISKTKAYRSGNT